VFEDYANTIRQRYPNIHIEGDNYPPTAMKQMMSQVLGIVKIALIVAIIAGQNPFQMMGMQTPSAFEWAINNKLSSCMLLFFIGNAIEGQLIATGAFEVSFNDQLLWSKLESGRVPQPEEMFRIIEDQIRLVGRH